MKRPRLDSQDRHLHHDTPASQSIFVVLLTGLVLFPMLPPLSDVGLNSSSLITTLAPLSSSYVDVRLMSEKQLQSAFPNIFTPLELLSSREVLFHPFEVKLVGHRKPRYSELTSKSFKEEVSKGIDTHSNKLEQSKITALGPSNFIGSANIKFMSSASA